MAEDADKGARHLVLVHGRDKARSMVEPEYKSLIDCAPGRGVAAPIPGWSEEVRPPRQAD